MSQDHRHAQRRRELVSATRRVAVARGISATNVRAVAAEASVSAGSVLYYFSNFQALMLAAVEGVLEEFYERRRDICDQYDDPRSRIVALIAAGVPDTISDDLRIIYESIQLLREQPEFKPLHRSIVERQVMLYRTTIEIGAGIGVFQPVSPIGTIARNLVALEDAYDLYPLIGLDLNRDLCRRNVESYAALSLGCDLTGYVSAS